MAMQARFNAHLAFVPNRAGLHRHANRRRQRRQTANSGNLRALLADALGRLGQCLDGDGHVVRVGRAAT